MTLRRLRELYRAFFPPRFPAGLRATTRRERESVASRAQTWRIVAMGLLLFVGPLVVTALHLWFTPGDTWIPEELS